MKLLLGVFDILGNTLLDGKEEGDPDSSVHQDSVSFFALKKNTSQFNGTTISSPQGSVDLVENFWEEEECLESTVGSILLWL
jgi:hypothetical protein